MTQTTFVGIGVSKATIDAFINGFNEHKVFTNTFRGYDALLNWIGKHVPDSGCKELRVCFEHTGLYSIPLATYLAKASIPFCMISALQIKRSLGIARGKTDRIDTKIIADYAYTFREKLILTKLPDREIMQLHLLLSLRDRLVKTRAGFEAPKDEQKRFLMHSDVLDFSPVYSTLIEQIKVQEKQIDKTIQLIISRTPELKTTFDLITSIKGVGKIVGAYMIVYTHNFTRFSTWRKFACFAGTAPFQNESGTTYRGKTKVSSLANKKIKKMLHISSLCASRYDTELSAYYHKRVQVGKSKMATLNILRNKILARIFAVATRRSAYVDLNKYAA
ncbi:transposase [Pedobacter sp. SD-b]|uniref:Transposase n=1 Tax=Pedobacter segetis TaxID=2793069 RepID=A0ABS1BLA1_9SPHI|nr:transposase [Pedobacter segetis]MBK0383588.1 transposase [Pedobacter segetis]